MMWLAFAFAVVGPLFLTNILWFTAIDRVGPSRATLFANLQPFFAVLFALVLLTEHLTRWRWSPAAPRSRAAIVLERAASAENRQGLTPRLNLVDMREPSRAASPAAARLRLHDRPHPRDLRRADGDAAARGARPDDRRDGPTRLIAVNHRMFVRNSGPITANARQIHISVPN